VCMYVCVCRGAGEDEGDSLQFGAI
jgi:hypothetical protein